MGVNGRGAKGSSHPNTGILPRGYHLQKPNGSWRRGRKGGGGGREEGEEEGRREKRKGGGRRGRKVYEWEDVEV